MGNYVLVVDDHLLTGQAVVETMRILAGHSSHHVTDGRAALRHLRRDPEACAIMLDLMMPGMNGFELLETLQADARLREIPVVVYTAMVAPFGECIGARAVLRKPVSTRVLVETLCRCCCCARLSEAHAAH